MYIFGGVIDVHGAARDAGSARPRPSSTLVTANAIFLAPVPPGPITIDVEVLRDGRQRVAGRGRPPRPRRRRPGVARARRVRRARTTPISRIQEVRFPEVPRPAPRSRRRRTDRPNPFGEINFHEQTEWRPVSPLDDPGKGQFLVVGAALHDAVPTTRSTRSASRCTATCSAPRSAARSARPTNGTFMVLSLEIGIRFVATPVTPWVLQEIEAWHIGDGYATGPGAPVGRSRQSLRDRHPDREPAPPRPA